MKKETRKTIVYQAPSGAVEVRLDEKRETIMLTQQQVGQLFDVQKAAISKHVKNILDTRELDKKSTVSILETVQTEGKRKIIRKIEYYNLDLILSIGYRVNSANATKFRQWATKTLRQHILDGYTINKKRLAKNYEAFLCAVEDVKKLLPAGGQVRAEDALELVKMFALTWLSLDAYDKGSFPKTGATKKQIKVTADSINKALIKLKERLVAQKEASELFGAERMKESVAGIIGNVFQSFGGNDLYPTVEEKAAHLLYFMVKNHPFVDGNKRSGAFASAKQFVDKAAEFIHKKNPQRKLL
ncbi:death-on-curing protein [bacterium (Candidatus Gribaldobacteria) CG08_land_8_20_14_0_20_39_15]|uniref:Death-on-curing protein n=1 Tax=bacterium (Candidatus Gribaldobacteria) CG08_land_8_20_14_0_20_39_15 TaxID=2014273 RepID=A0A2M6XTU6_9BACT|nr:MAG: death-on-curing protein [bacterium (Candidatus Gribaldobacteria) CG08_land_8_20_14_0_20_39_15]